MGETDNKYYIRTLFYLTTDDDQFPSTPITYTTQGIFRVQRIACLLDVMHVSEQKANFSSTLLNPLKTKRVCFI
jgi:hypothetical protein